ncbi:MAG: Na(+)-translocating NADH-quinone reductase subunit A [Bacteroidales bacterium]|nr:Na(+)-translocating NADH-quinone reductase subunit A [Bacteroidales bacterium]
MSTVIKIKKGLDIHLAGEAKKETEVFEVRRCAIKPSDFIGIIPKLHVAEGDVVKAGSVLFHDKNRENILFTSPISGTVRSVVRGEKRAIMQVVVEADGRNEAIDFGKADMSSLKRNEVIDKMLQSGIWTMLRQRPYSTIANPNDKPKCIVVSMFNSAPLAPSTGYIIENQVEAFNAGVEALSKLTDGKLYLNLKATCKRCHDVVAKINKPANVVVTDFQGPHPAGNVGTQINALCPINKGEAVWYCGPQEVITIGKLFLTGKYDSSRIIALTGSEANNPHYYKVNVGANIEPLVSGGVNVRIISGDVLTGKNITGNNLLGFYDSQITVIPEGNEYRLFGWLAPNFKRFTSTNTMGSSFFKKKTFVLDTNRNGDIRPLIMTGKFEKVFPFDIYPMQLLKACIIKDIDQMEELGIYEVDAEDFALCEVIDPSKTAIQQIIRDGLELIREEMN